MSEFTIKKFGLIMIAALVIAFPLSRSTSAAEKDLLWERMINAQVDFQNSLADLLVSAIPDAKELILIQRDLQIVMREIRSRQYYYLLETDPSRIVRTEGISRWINFDWSKDDEARLLMDPSYASLVGRKEKLYGQNQGHPMWPVIRAGLPDVMATEEYQNIMRSHTKTLDEIESMLLK